MLYSTTRYLQALCYYRVEQYDSALAVLTSFETKNPASQFLLEACYWKAKNLVELDKLDKAKVLLQEIAQREPYEYYAHRARDLLMLMGDSVTSRLSIDTVSDSTRAVRWLDSVSLGVKRPFAFEDSLNVRRGVVLAAIGATAEAEMFLEPIELTYPGNLSFEFKIATFYRSIGAPAQAALAGRRLSWRIPSECRAALSLPVYSLMYPLFFRDIVKSEAIRRNVDPYFVFAVIRQESVFNPAIASSAGAIGLMQIMPATGKAIAQDLKEPFAIDTLYRPAGNIRYGTYYLRSLLDQFNENEVLTLASYNGGPPNAKEWYLRNKGKDFDLFVEDIDFSETRKYVKKVLANYWVYRKLGRIGSFAAQQ